MTCVHSRRSEICAAVICGVATNWFCRLSARMRLLKHSARSASVTPRIVDATSRSHANGMPPNVGTRDFAERSFA